MVVNLLMLVALVLAVVCWWKHDNAVMHSHRLEGVDAVRFAEARRRARVWFVWAVIASAAYVVLWYW